MGDRAPCLLIPSLIFLPANRLYLRRLSVLTKMVRYIYIFISPTCWPWMFVLKEKAMVGGLLFLAVKEMNIY